MKHRLLLISFALLSVAGLKAQVSINDFDPGVIVLSNGDSLQVRIKPDREERMSRQIQVWDAQNNGPKRYQPKDVKFFSVNKENFYALKEEEGRSVFMQQKVAGAANLFGYTYREDKGKKEIVTDFYIKKEGGGLIKVPTQPSKFKSDMALYFSDFPALSEKIATKQYGYYDMEAVTEEYNAWIKAGKPKNDDRFTSEPSGPKLVNNKPKEDNNNRIGIDIPLYASYNFVSYPTALNQLYTTRTIGFGFDVGIGARFRLVRGLTLRTGVNFRDKGMKVSSDNLQIQIKDNNGNQYTDILKVREQGRMYYPGIYLNLGQEWSHFHVGGGFNLSFYSFYRGKYSLESQNFPQLNETVDRSKVSFIVHDLTDSEGRGKNFNMQFDINFSVGGRFKIGEFITLKPTIMYSIPMIPLYNSGVSVQGS